jgi:hypothetical protein
MLPAVPATPRTSGSYTPSLRSIWLAAPVTLLAAMAVVAVAFLVLRSQHLTTSGGKDVADLDLVKAALTVVAGAGIVLGGVYAYRKQRLAEGDARRSDADLLADRYTAAADQLGSERAATRMAGVYAMARLADDWEEHRQTCIDVLCGYLRLPYDLLGDTAEREVRRTLVRVMRDHLREKRIVPSWQPYNFSFEGARFGRGDLTDARFSGRVSFHGATFEIDRFHFTNVCFDGAGAWFEDVRIRPESEVRFEGTHFGAKDMTFKRARDASELTIWNCTRRPGADVDWGPFSTPPERP